MKTGQRLEAVANVATILMVIIFGATMLRDQRSSIRRAPPRFDEAKKGFDLKTKLPDVDWRKNHRTIVLGLQTTCHFCSDSAPFFQKLSAVAAGKATIIAVLPQTVPDSTAYLAGKGIHVDAIRQSQLESIGVSGTPTVLFVDQQAKVTDVWRGKLPPEKEAEVLAAVTKN